MRRRSLAEEVVEGACSSWGAVTGDFFDAERAYLSFCVYGGTNVRIDVLRDIG